VVDGHQHHDGAAKNIDRLDTLGGLHG
jgi:hypothetical protein